MELGRRESWKTRVGLILAMAGNAVGLGNFLRFPVQAAQNGGGAFLIPYFISFLLLGIPMMWVEWAIGRHGGKYCYGTAPGMFSVLWRSRGAKYLGVLGLFIPSVILIYYCYIESWTLGYSFYSLLRKYFGIGTYEGMKLFLHSYQQALTPEDVKNLTSFPEGIFATSILPAYVFLLITFSINFFVLYRGVAGGIEKLAKIAMPLLFLFATAIVIRVFTIGTPDPAHPDWNVENGLAFIWNPDFSKLGHAKVWLAAAGQMFFTLSLGMGIIMTYASYVKESEDIALGGLATASTNELAEIVLGGSIAIPIAVAFFGSSGMLSIANEGAFNLAFASMPVVFQEIPFGHLFGAMWFLLLFFAGITSSVALAQPTIAFLEEEFNLTRHKAVAVYAVAVFLFMQPVVFFQKYGFLNEMDYWAATFGVVLLALVEVLIFTRAFGMKNAWEEITRGSSIKVPKIFYFVIKWITPLFLIIMLTSWVYQSFIPVIRMEGVPQERVPYYWGARIMLVLIAFIYVFMVFSAWRRKGRF